MREAATRYSAEGGFQGKEDVIEVPVDCPPPSSEFIRVRDDDDYWTECMTLDYEPEGGRRETYFIATDLMNSLPPEIESEVKWSRLYTTMARRGSVTSLWRIKIYDIGPGQLSTRTHWHAPTKLSACGHVSHGKAAMCHFTRKAISANRSGRTTPSRNCWTSRSRQPISTRSTTHL